MHRGYVKDWRKTEDSLIWRMPPIYHRVWVWIIRHAAHQDNTVVLGKLGQIEVKRGQVLTSIGKIAEGVSWYERNRKKKPNKKTIYRVLQWFEVQEMIVIERNLTVTSRNGGSKCFKGNAPFTLITILNYNIYQAQGAAKSNAKSGVRVTPEGHIEECKRIKNISCGKLETLKGFLVSLPEFFELPEEAQRLIASFLNKTRLANKTRSINSGRVQRILNALVAILDKTSSEYLCAALEITIERAEAGQFAFNKHNVTGYVKAIAERKYQQAQQQAAQSKYEPQETDTEALYR